jgi:hypothetical protein
MNALHQRDAAEPIAGEDDLKRAALRKILRGQQMSETEGILGAGIEGRGRDLVEERLEHVMVAAVDERHPLRGLPQRSGGMKTAEAPAQDDH